MPTLYTIGHSTRPIDEFIGLLREHEIALLCDIRTVPKSRHNPQFGIDALPGSLEDAGIGYRHLAGLGGLRHAAKDSINSAWRNASFRGYADYMQTPEFAAALDELIALAEEESVVIMCSEAVPWRCHRSMVGDALVVRGWTVLDIIGQGEPKPRRLTPWAVVDGTQITYPAQDESADREATEGEPT